MNFHMKREIVHFWGWERGVWCGCCSDYRRAEYGLFGDEGVLIVSQ